MPISLSFSAKRATLAKAASFSTLSLSFSIRSLSFSINAVSFSINAASFASRSFIYFKLYNQKFLCAIHC